MNVLHDISFSRDQLKKTTVRDIYGNNKDLLFFMEV